MKTDIASRHDDVKRNPVHDFVPIMETYKLRTPQIAFMSLLIGGERIRSLTMWSWLLTIDCGSLQRYYDVIDVD